MMKLIQPGRSNIYIIQLNIAILMISFIVICKCTVHKFTAIYQIIRHEIVHYNATM